MQRFTGILLSLAVLLCLAQSATAAIYPQEGDQFRIDWHQITNQSEGPFEMNGVLHNGRTPDTYLSFCVESKEYFWPGHTYEVQQLAGIDPKKSSKTGRTLSGYGAWVYNQFMANAIPFSAIPANKGLQLNLVQQAIWAGMVGDELGVGVMDTTGWDWAGGNRNTAHLGDFKGAEFGISDWTAYNNLGIGYSQYTQSLWFVNQGASYTGNVVLLNLIDPDRNIGDPYYFAQDQLGLGGPPESSGFVPEPGSMIVWALLGCLGVAVASWRRKRIA
jgi:hypothetical protein